MTNDHSSSSFHTLPRSPSVPRFLKFSVSHCPAACYIVPGALHAVGGEESALIHHTPLDLLGDFSMARSVPPLLPGARPVRALGRLGAAALLLFIATLLTRAEVPVSVDPARTDALALDKKIIAQVKEGSDLMANL